MNKQRRADIARAKTLIDEAKSIIESASEEEREYFENMPESMQNGEKGERASDVAASLDEQAGMLEDITQSLDDACQ